MSANAFFCLNVFHGALVAGEGNRRYGIGNMIFWMVLMLLCQSAPVGKAAATLLAFGDFPAPRPFHGVPATPILQTAGQRLFRTRIREAARKGPNFAGHYTIAEWGCGSSCVSVAVIDAETGAVCEGPFGRLPNALLSYGEALQYDRDAKGEYQDEELSYRLNSRLFIARGCANDVNCAAYFYEWTGSQFELLRKLPATPEPR
jgi:hypothetical protein